MPKFMVLYNSSAKANELMANASPEEMKASMNEWIQWRDDLPEDVKFDFGLPLQAVSRVTTSGLTTSDSPVNGYATIEGESKEAVLDLLKNHPHLKRPDATIDVLEMLSMPGLEA
ncbi:MAG TPA: hypothetical protein VLE72_01820 [Candidatus Saccharimonadales bacterium]|nr:hypothetical protein [Candidatus Saccharimonadales bacterium]